ncbi:MAG: hypothetical protein H6R15_1609 [Proteobacteria bacterium]|nr:hypothetical protein [Pseudomonadota bacterium]
MKPTARDFGKLRWALLGASASLALAGLLGFWSDGQLASAQRQHEAQRASHLRLEQQLRQADGEAHELTERARLFRQWQASGMVGEENRRQWDEVLHDAHHALGLPAMDYDFSPATPLAGAGRPGHDYFSSRLHLRAKLLHESDLLRLLERIEKQAPAFVLTRRCHLARASENLAEAFLDVECDMDWITIKPVAASQ